MLTVTQNNAADITDTKTVNKHLASFYRVKLFDIFLIKLYNIAYIAYKYIFMIHSHLICKLSVLSQMLLLAVNRNEILRLYNAVKYFKLLLTGVTRNVNLVHRLVDNLTASL